MDEIIDGKLVGDITGTVMSGCSVEPGIVGNSVYFDGVSAWIDLGNHRDRYALTILRLEQHDKRFAGDIYKYNLF